MKIQLVDDDKKIATVVKRGLDAEGYTVEVALTELTDCGSPPKATTT